MSTALIRFWLATELERLPLPHVYWRTWLLRQVAGGPR